MRIRKRNNRIEIRTPAKINFCLDVLGRRSDGFHELDTVISPVSLYDSISFSPRRDDQFLLRVEASHRVGGTIPCDSSNLIIKALETLRRIGPSGRFCGFDIRLTKRIPSPAGLGGGSSNAAGAIRVANQCWGMGLSTSDMMKIGSEVGSDVPCFFYDGPTRCRGRGELVEPLPASSIPIVIVSPDVELPTADVFRKFASDGAKTVASSSANAVVDAMSGGGASLGDAMSNDLESTAMAMCDRIEGIAKEFAEQIGCLGHQMSGSGASYFGIFNSQKTARSAAFRLRARLPNSKVCAVRSLGISQGSLSVSSKEINRSGLCE